MRYLIASLVLAGLILAPASVSADSLQPSGESSSTAISPQQMPAANNFLQSGGASSQGSQASSTSANYLFNSGQAPQGLQLNVTRQGIMAEADTKSPSSSGYALEIVLFCLLAVVLAGAGWLTLSSEEPEPASEE